MALLNDGLDEDVRAEKVLAILDKDEQVEGATEQAQPQPQEGAQQETAPAAVETGAEETQPAAPQEDGSGEPAKPVIEPPKFLKADMRDKWKSLPTEWQEYWSRQEEENSRTVSTKLEEAAVTRRQSEAREKAAQEAQAKATQEQQRYVQQLATLSQAIESIDPVVANYRRLMQTGELAKLGRDNPAQYAELDAAYKGRMQALEQINAERTRAQSEMLQAHFAREEQALVEKLPEWKAPEVGNKAMGELREAAVRLYGFKPEEVKTVADHRYVLMARDAMAYHTLKAEFDKFKEDVAKEKETAAASLAAKRTAPAPTKTVRPNATTENAQRVSTDRNKAFIQQARKVRSLGDKAALIAQTIEG